MTTLARVLRFGVRVVFVGISTAGIGTAMSETFAFGARELEVPAPEGFVPVSARAPEYVKLATGYLPSTVRLIEIYTLASDRDKLAGDPATGLARYFQLVVSRQVDGARITPAHFDAMMSPALKQIESIATAAAQRGRELTRDGNTAARAITGTERDIELDAMTPLGVFRHDVDTVGISMRNRVTHNGETLHNTGSSAFALIDGQILTFGALSYEPADGPLGRAWTEAQVNRWVDATRAANSD